MNATEQIRVRGELEIEVRRKGVLIERWAGANVVTEAGKDRIAERAGGLGEPISRIGIGEDGTAATPQDTALVNSYAQDVDSVGAVAGQRVRFAFDIGAGQGTGTVIREFGLLTADGVMCARRVRTNPITKDADTTVSGQWTLILS